MSEPQHFGLCVGRTSTLDGSVMYAEVMPASLRHWRPWRYRTSRWWFEVHSYKDGEGTTWGYSDGGSGGGFTLRSCVFKADAAVNRLSIIKAEETK